jgi:hypothetical protein
MFAAHSAFYYPTLLCFCASSVSENLLQHHAEALGNAAKVDKSFILNFGEEVVRGQPVFVLSGLLQDLERHLRDAAGAGPWQVRPVKV